MRTHGHREESTTHWGLLGRIGLGQWGGAGGEIPDVGEGEEDSKSHYHACTYATILHVLHMYPKTLNAVKRKKERKKNKGFLKNKNKYNKSRSWFFEKIHKIDPGQINIKEKREE